MTRKLFIAALCLLSALASVAPLHAATLADANAEFAKGDFQSATTGYEKLLADQGPDATLYYNLGNARQQLKQYGPAILAYERARLITPRDPDLLANLTLARKAATAFEENGGSPRLEAVTGYLSRNEWSWLVTGGALAIGIVAFVSGAIGLKRSTRRIAWTAAGLALLLATAGGAALWLRRAETGHGIILSEKAALLLSPFENAESIGTPGQGRIVMLGKTNGGFHYVTVPGTSLAGWLAGKDVAAVIPK